MTSGSDMIEAAKKGDIGAVRRLATQDPALCGFRSASGETPLIAALYRGHRGVVDTLVELGAPLDIFAAAALGRIDLLHARIAERPEAVNEFAFDGWTPLHLAAFFGHTEAAARLLDAGGAVNAISQNSLRNTPLHAAIAGGHVEGALLLIERGADVGPRTRGPHAAPHRRGSRLRAGRRGAARTRRRSARGRRRGQDPAVPRGGAESSRESSI